MRFRRARPRFRWIPTLTTPTSIAGMSAGTSYQTSLIDSTQILNLLTGDCTLVRIVGDFQASYTGTATAVPIDRLQLGLLRLTATDAGASPATANLNPYEGTDSPYFEWLWTRSIFAGNLSTQQFQTGVTYSGPLAHERPSVDIRRKIRLRMGDTLIIAARPVGTVATWQVNFDVRMLFRIGRR